MNLESCFVPISPGNICQDCVRNIAQCPWLHADQPVPGWTARKVTKRTARAPSGANWVETYAIETCPLYLPAPPRNSDPAELTEEQSKLFLALRGKGANRRRPAEERRNSHVEPGIEHSKPV